MAVCWGLCLMWVCAWAFLQMDCVNAAPGLLSELLGLVDDSVVIATPGAESYKAKTIKASKITTTTPAATTATHKPTTSQIQNKPPPGLSSTPNAKNALSPGPPGQSDKKCVFPFTFGNKKHFDCTVEGSIFHWCSLTDKYSGKWKYCTDDDRARCVFPFIFEGHVYKDCITKGSLFRMAWCSLSPYYDHDKAWKYCY
ncbi:seminal plasma protein BSP-30 kDa-like [Oryctolagus cuniculus]|uniref:seminal plasma protein BSP-30 kDa-like n=1 Tax=Oryctolagus cuniculus TaxID=9986 RepID=UPI000491EFCA